MNESQEILQMLEQFESEHRELDEKINLISREKVVDHLTVQQLKKQKLLLKDKISYIKTTILPDIIA